MKLIPHVSTHFRFLAHKGNNPADLTIGKIYKIQEWRGSCFMFWDDVGEFRVWADDPSPNQGFRYQNSGVVEDTTFKRLLEKVLE